MGAEITPQFPVLCPLTHAPQWTHPTGGTGRRDTCWTPPRARLTVTYSTWYFMGRRDSCWTLPQGTPYSYIPYMALRNLYFQSNFSEDSCNQPTNKQTNESDQRRSLPLLSLWSYHWLTGWVTCGVFSRDSAFPLPQPWAFHARAVRWGGLEGSACLGAHCGPSECPPNSVFLEWSS